MTDDADALRRLPKVELHCHLEGALRHSTVADLARRYGDEQLSTTDPTQLWDVTDLDHYLQVYDAVARLVRTADDFRRVVHEHLVDSAALGLVHTELFWSPMVHLDDGVPYDVQLEGLAAGIADAERDTGVTCRLIPAIDRERPTSEAHELLDLVLEHRDDLVVGVGLDYSERLGPPERFVEVFDRVGRAGLGRTAHAGEEGDAGVVAGTIELLGCRRVDHGYAILADPALVQRAVDLGVMFTVCPTGTTLLRGWGCELPGGVPEMVDAGLTVCINTDAPPQYATDLAEEHRLAAAWGVGLERLQRCVDDAVEACFLDDTERRELRARVRARRLEAASPASPGGSADGRRGGP